MSYLFENQVTPSELDALAKKVAELVDGVIRMNLQENIKGKLRSVLSMVPPAMSTDVLGIHYNVDVGVGLITAELGKIRAAAAKNVKRKKR
ncbi:MAG: hypothetical protein M0R00_06870 [Candidatus Omnitrophica bacterium]|jgi:hypothetical protein|nr:hypothetical protein [Candidatus Omnitrophota bacterium]